MGNSLNNDSAFDRPRQRWWKGNLHMHSLWSDGDEFPEVIAAWFKTHGYHFIAFTEHDRLQQGEMWFDPNDRQDMNPNQDLSAMGSKYRAAFGADWVETLTEGGREQIRIKPLHEYRQLFEEPDRFTILMGEEITVRVGQKTHWMNAWNLSAPISPQSAADSPTAIQKVIDAVQAHNQEYGGRAITQLNHPNYAWNASASDISLLRDLNFLEIYAALGSTRSYGDTTHSSVERIWDEVLTYRLRKGWDVVFGTFSDDSHFYNKWHRTNPYGHPGCAWMMVRCQVLSPDSIIQAMINGDCYGSTGVTIKELAIDDKGIHLEIEQAPGVDHVIHFIGTRLDSSECGQILQSVQGSKADYRFMGDELYVRARVESSRLHPQPHDPGEVQKAWTQPIRSRTRAVYFG